VGGAALADAAWLERFAAQAARASEPLLIVHGGGPEISAVSQALGVPVEWRDGRRVTTPAVLDAAQMVLSGLVNKRIVAALRQAGVDAVGLSGMDGGLVRAELAQNGALGRVGRVTAVRAELLEWLQARGASVVLSPISLGVDGDALNVNADEVAAAVAAATGAAELVFLTDVPGVRVHDRTAAALDAAEAMVLIASGAATGGMAVKLEAGSAALAAGVAAVRIGDLETLTSTHAGTALRRTLEAVA
jgi:acetylglutamate kinase